MSETGSARTPGMRLATPFEVVLNPERILRWSVAAICFLVLANFVAIYVRYELGRDAWGLVRQFDLNEEANLPTMFSALYLLACGLMLLSIAQVKSRAKDAYTRHWFWLGVIFCAMSADEFAQLHEMTMAMVKKLHVSHGFFFYGWAILGLPFVIVVGLLYLDFVRRLPGNIGWAVVIAGAIYLGGALGMDMISGKYVESLGGDDHRNLIYGLMTTLEETMEMTGEVLFFWALGKHARDLGLRMSLSVGRRATIAVAQPVVEGHRKLRQPAALPRE